MKRIKWLCDFRDKAIKVSVVFVLLFSPSLWSFVLEEARCRAIKTLTCGNGHVAEGQGSQLSGQQGTGASRQEPQVWACTHPPAPVKPSHHCNSRQHIDGNLMRHLNQNLPAKLLSEFGPSETHWDNKCSLFLSRFFNNLLHRSR